jgi:ADP-ribosylglycohydrolase
VYVKDRELTKIHEGLLYLSRIVDRSGTHRAEEPWGGAGVVITNSAPKAQQTESFYPEPCYVVTADALELSWAFERLRDIFLPMLNGGSKIEFFGRLANSANRFLNSDGSNLVGSVELVRSVIDEANAIANEMESGTFYHLDIAPGLMLWNDFLRKARKADSVSSTFDSVRYHRIAGSLFGSAIGDAMGAAFEFANSDMIARHLDGRFSVSDFMYPIPSSLLYGRGNAWPTDDTAMAFCVAATLLRFADPSAADFAADFLRFLVDPEGRYGRMFWEGAPGGATTRALARLDWDFAPESFGEPDDGGNGAAMRAHPVGFLTRREDVLVLASRQACVTHGHPSAIAAAQAVAVLVHDAIAGGTPSLDPPVGIDDPLFIGAWHSSHKHLKLTNGRLPKHLRDANMSGWETVAAAHAITMCFPNDPAGAIGAAAASGGDTDTVAAIVGAIVGARYGVNALPSHLRTGLRCAEEVEAFAQALSECPWL